MEEPPDAAPRSAGARRLLHNHDGTVELEGDFVLVCDCPGQATDAAVRGVSTFALTVSTVVGTLAATGVAPRPVGLFALGWIGASWFARRWAARRRLEHGRFTIDFERARVRREQRGASTEMPLDEGIAVELSEPDGESEGVRWLLLRRGEARYRLARGTAEELSRVLYVLRRQGLRAPVA